MGYNLFMVDYDYIGDLVCRDLGLVGSDVVYCKRVVRSYMYRLGYVCQYGGRYVGDGLTISPHPLSLRKRMSSNNFWLIDIQNCFSDYLRGRDYDWYFGILRRGYNSNVERMLGRYKLRNKKKEWRNWK